MEDSQEWQGQTEGWVVVVKDEISTEAFPTDIGLFTLFWQLWQLQRIGCS